MVGFRQQTGELAGFQSFQTLDLPTLCASSRTAKAPAEGDIYRVSDKPHVWHATSCLNSGHQITTHILNTLSNSPHVKAFDEMPDTNTAPVFRVTFVAQDHTVALRQLSSSEIAEVQASKTRKEPRIGFLSQRWVQNVQARRTMRPTTGAELNY